MSEPTVSAIITTYNRAHMVGEAIQSVLDQTYADFELIVVDDGSIDDTKKIVLGFADERIQYVYQPNAGLAAARNTGIRHSTGKYLAFLDDDDLFLPNKLELQVPFLEHNPEIGWVSGGFFVTDGEHRVLAERRPWTSFPDLRTKTWLFSCMIAPHTTLITHQWLTKVGGFDPDMRYGEDWDLWLRLAHAGCQMAWIEYPVCCYRMHATNLTREGTKFKLGFVRMLDKFFSQPELPPELRALEAQAYARIYLEGAVREYRAQQIDEAKIDLERAFGQVPSHHVHELKETFLQLIVAWANHPLTESPYQYINLVFDNLPPIVSGLRTRRRETMARFSISRFFEASQNRNWPEVKRMFARSITSDPSWLTNRGVWSIMGSAVIGPQLMSRLRSVAKTYLNRGIESPVEVKDA